MKIFALTRKHTNAVKIKNKGSLVLKKTAIGLFTFILLFVGCEKTRQKKVIKSQKDQLSPPFVKAVLTEEKLNKELYIGMSKNDVIKKFGMPTMQDKYKNGITSFTYLREPISNINQLKDSRLEGFSIDLKNDKVEFWSIIESHGQ